MRYIGSVALCCWIIGFSLAGHAADVTAVVSVKQACDILKQTAAHFCSSQHKMIGRCACDPVPGRPAYYVLGLHCSSGTPREVIGSSLVGWYAVDKSDGAVFEWDINEDRLVPLESVSGQSFWCE